MRMAARLAAMGQQKYENTTRISGGRAKWNGRITLDENALAIPRKWTVGRMIFVNSMSDIFHDDVPLGFLKQVFEVMRDTPQHTYQVLTKRAENLESRAKELPWPDNIWMGVSVENEDYTWRIDHLRRTPAATKFLSLEPLLGPLAFATGDSPIDAVKIEPTAIRDQCLRAGVAFHFKQWGGVNKKRTGRILDGRVWNEWPDGQRSGTRPSEQASLF